MRYLLFFIGGYYKINISFRSFQNPIKKDIQKKDGQVQVPLWHSAVMGHYDGRVKFEKNTFNMILNLNKRKRKTVLSEALSAYMNKYVLQYC